MLTQKAIKGVAVVTPDDVGPGSGPLEQPEVASDTPAVCPLTKPEPAGDTPHVSRDWGEHPGSPRLRRVWECDNLMNELSRV